MLIQWTFGQELVVLHTIPPMFGKLLVHTWSQCGYLNKSSLYQFIEGRTHFGMPRGAKMSLARNEPI